MTVEELLSRISAPELIEWMQYYRLEPFGSEANFMGHAITASTIANANRGKGKTFTLKDFMPDFMPKEKKSAKETFDTLKQAIMLGNWKGKGKQ
jgi:hypothetical protein